MPINNSAGAIPFAALNVAIGIIAQTVTTNINSLKTCLLNKQFSITDTKYFILAI